MAVRVDQSAQPGQVAVPPQYVPLFEAASAQYGIPYNILTGIAHRESRFNPEATGPMTRYGPARGMMQFIDDTWSSYGEGSPYDPNAAVPAAAAYLSALTDQYPVSEHGWGPALASYHSGPGLVQQVLAGEAELGPVGQQYIQDPAFNVPQASLAPLLSPGQPGPTSGQMMQAALAAQGGSAPVQAALAPQPDRGRFIYDPLFGMGVGLLGAAGPSTTPQNPFLAAMQGAVMSEQMAAERDERRRAGQPEPTSAMRNMAALEQMDPAQREMFMQVLGSGATNINVNPDGSPVSPQQERLMEINGDRLVTMAEQIDQDRDLAYALDQFERNMARYNSTGALGDLRLGILQFGDMLGVDGLSDELEAGEAMSAVTSFLTPRMRVPGSGATSDMEMRTFRDSIPNLMRSPGGNQLVIDGFRRIMERRQAVYEIAERLYVEATPETFQRRFQEEVQALGSLFNDEEMQQISAARNDGLPAPTSAEERDALPSGTRYVAPDGSIRVRE